jgi:hypothetical protein
MKNSTLISVEPISRNVSSDLLTVVDDDDESCTGHTAADKITLSS